MEMTKEQTIALAKARRRKANVPPQPPSNWEVSRQAAIRGPAELVDSVATGVAVAPQMAYGAAASALGRPDLAPEIEKPVTAVTDFFTNNRNLPESLQLNPEALQGQTPGQEILGAAVEGASTGLTGLGRKGLTSAALSGAGGAAAEAVTQWTDNPILGLAASVAAPLLLGKAIPQLEVDKKVQRIQNALKDKTYKEAHDLGLFTIPDSKLATYAGRPELLKAAEEVNQDVVNNIARSEMRLPKASTLDDNTISSVLQAEYKRGYAPLENMGTFSLFVDPRTNSMPYIDDLIAIDQRYTGAKGTFPDAVPKALKDLTYTYMSKGVLDSKDTVDTIRRLRQEASKALKSLVVDDIKEEIAYAKKAIADALERELERQAVKSGMDPKILETFRDARTQIAKTHLIDDVLERGSGKVDAKKLANKYQRGEYMSGDLEKIAAYYNINRPDVENAKDLVSTYFKHVLGYQLAGVAGASMMGMDSGLATAALAVSGALGLNLANQGFKAASRKFIMSSKRQKRAAPDYESRVASQAAALSGIGYFESMDKEE